MLGLDLGLVLGFADLEVVSQSLWRDAHRQLPRVHVLAVAVIVLGLMLVLVFGVCCRRHHTGVGVGVGV